MTEFVFLSLGLVVPTLAIVVVAGFTWHEVRKERRRAMALRQWLRAQG